MRSARARTAFARRPRTLPSSRPPSLRLSTAERPPSVHATFGDTQPEGLDLTEHRGRTLVAIGLERGNAVALVDVNDPRNPTVIAVASEVSGTVTIFEVIGCSLGRGAPHERESV